MNTFVINPIQQISWYRLDFLYKKIIDILYTLSAFSSPFLVIKKILELLEQAKSAKKNGNFF